MGAPVTHFEILGRPGSAKQLQDFYAALFDWKIDASNPMNYGMVAKEGEGIGGGVGEGRDEGGWVTIYVEVDDLRAALDKAVSLGGTIINEPMEVPGGPELAHFEDPSGQIIGLAKGMPR